MTSRTTELHSVVIAKFLSLVFLRPESYSSPLCSCSTTGHIANSCDFLKTSLTWLEARGCTSSMVSSCGLPLKLVSLKVSFKEFSDY